VEFIFVGVEKPVRLKDVGARNVWFSPAKECWKKSLLGSGVDYAGTVIRIGLQVIDIAVGAIKDIDQDITDHIQFQRKAADDHFIYLVGNDPEFSRRWQYDR